MNNVGEKFLPLGTVVMLKGASKRLMITGFCTMAAEEARNQDCHVLEQVFTFTANQEKEHAEIFYNHLNVILVILHHLSLD